MNIEVTRQFDEVKAFIASIPPMLEKEVPFHFAQFMTIKLRPYAPYQFVKRATAYPNSGSKYPERWVTKSGKAVKPIPGYFSLRQHNFVMAGIAKGTITPGTPNRTGAIQDAWEASQTETGALISNYSPGVSWVLRDGWQANQPRLVGHQTAYTTITENLPEAEKDMAVFIQESLKKLDEKGR